MSHNKGLRASLPSSILAGIVLLFAMPLAAQAAWTKLSPTNSPSGRDSHSMCTDAVRKVTVLFGYRSANDTWEWNGKNWTQKSPTTSPPFLGYAGMSFDSARRVCVLFGGLNGSGSHNQTWEWNGSNWKQIKTTNRPATRYGHAQCYDSRRKVTVVFSGLGGSPYHPDTWEYDGNDWKQVATSGPIGRTYCRMEYDLLRGVSVLFSGYAGRARPSAYIQDTWEWNGKNWKQIQLACQPVARWGHSMTYSLPRGIVMFGGQTQLTANNGLTNDVWVCDGRSWSEVKATGAPSARRLHATAIDPGSNRVLLFGGSVGGGETHTLDLKNFATAMYEPYGTSCKGSNSNPALGALNCNPPFLNETFTAQVTNIPSGAKTNLIFGVSNTTWGTYQLPMDWSGFGFTGCSLQASLDLFVTMSTSGTSASFAAKVPNDSNLVGTTFFNQAFVFDATANASGATLTNGAAGKVGRR